MTITTINETQRVILVWIARIGAGGAEEVAGAFGISVAAARARLCVCERAGLLDAVRLLHGQPALYVATRAGLCAAGLAELKPCRVSPGGFAHLRSVARTAVALERALPGAAVVAERELRVWERDARRPLASAELGLDRTGEYARHRPDLVLWPAARVGELAAPAVAVEVELTVKASARLAAIVRGWARSRLVDAVVYYASPQAMRALRTAVAAEQAQETVHLLALERIGELPAAVEALLVGASPPGSGRRRPCRSTSPVPSPT